MYNYINVLQKAGNASWKRMEVISDNIANVSTPGYKRKDVSFETYLQAQIGDGYSLDECINNIELDELMTTTYTDNTNLSYRFDGNNVNIDTENAEMAKTQIHYKGLMESMTNEYNRIKTALSRN